MFKSYLKITVRTLWKHKLFSFINVFGLAAGMLICILAVIDTNKAFNYDTFHPLAARTYRVVTDLTFKGNQREAYASTPFPVAEQLKNNYDFIEDIVHVVPAKYAEYTAAGKTLKSPAFFTDASFFKVFGFRLQLGQFTEEPHTIVITDEAAKRFFGSSKVIGKVLQNKDWGNFLITGILQTPVSKSHLEFDALMSASTIAQIEKSGQPVAEAGSWTNSWSTYTYALLKNTATKKQLDAAIGQIAETATAAIGSKGQQQSFGFRSQLLADINPSREDFLNFAAGTTYGKLFVEIGIGLLTLFLAGFNYVNLTLARSLTRSKEIGLRKVIGATRRQVFTQFIFESVILALLALLLAGLMLEFLKPMAAIQDVFRDAAPGYKLYATLLIVTILTGIGAGSIPAWLLSSFKPALVIKGQKALTVLKGLTLRKALVVLQFAVSLTGIIVMLSMYRQQHFMATGDYGFAKENILNIDLYGTDRQKLTQEIQKLAGVEQTTASAYTLGVNGGNRADIARYDKSSFVKAEMLSADDKFIDVMQLRLVAGTNFLPGNNDSAGNLVLINETAAAKLNFADVSQATGQLIKLSDSSTVRIAGVLKDFHSMSMVFPIYPMLIRQNPAQYTVLQVKTIAGADKNQLKSAIEKSWKQLNPYQEFSAHWFDSQLYDRHFHGSDQLLMALLCGIVLCIACLGLLGMVTYSSEIRTKEIGVRKVMGAGIAQLLTLLSKDFAVLLLIAGCIALPFGFISSKIFLQNFTYHVFIGAGTLLSGFAALLFIGMSIIIWQTLRIAISNPVNTLRTE